VREVGGYAATDLGTDLVRQAFDPKKGSLTDLLIPESERAALAQLFVGAIGAF
jgi:hypothetical protein